MRSLPKILGLAALIATVSCSSTINTAPLFNNLKELEQHQTPKKIGQSGKLWTLTDYVIELTDTGGSVEYRLTYTWASGSNEGIIPIILLAEKKELNELGTILSSTYIRDGSAARNFDGIPDSGKENGIDLTPRKSKKLYEEITAKVLEEF